MKKAFIFIFVLFIPSFLFAQNTFKAGVLGGVLTSQIHGDAVGGFNKFGGQIGGFVTTDLNEKFTTAFEIYYIGKGSRKNPTKFSPYFWSIRLNYIEIPLLLKYHYKKYAAEGGLSFGRLISQKFLDNGLVFYPQNYRLFNKNEYAIIVGISYHKTENLSFGLRISQTLGNVRKFTFTYPRYYFFKFQSGSVNVLINFVAHYQLGN